MTESRIYLREHDGVKGVYHGQVLVRFETPFVVPATGVYRIEFDTDHPERTTLTGPIEDVIGGPS